jgi:hypothetical protein
MKNSKKMEAKWTPLVSGLSAASRSFWIVQSIALELWTSIVVVFVPSSIAQLALLLVSYTSLAAALALRKPYESRATNLEHIVIAGMQLAQVGCLLIGSLVRSSVAAGFARASTIGSLAVIAVMFVSHVRRSWPALVSLKSRCASCKLRGSRSSKRKVQLDESSLNRSLLAEPSDIAGAAELGELGLSSGGQRSTADSVQDSSPELESSEVPSNGTLTSQDVPPAS